VRTIVNGIAQAYRATKEQFFVLFVCACIIGIIAASFGVGKAALSGPLICLFYICIGEMANNLTSRGY